MKASTAGLMRFETGSAASGSTNATISHTAPAVSTSPVSAAHHRDSIANAVREMMSGVAKTRFAYMTPHERDALYAYLKARAEKP